MKLKLLKAAAMLAVLAAGLLPARCETNTTSYLFELWATNTVPDGNTSGMTDTRILPGQEGVISDINVSLDVSGGFNGDLYAYLVHDNVLVVLLNRVGRDSANLFGYDGTGLHITLDDQAANNVHWYEGHSPSYNAQGQLLGLWQPDGRNVDPKNVDETINPTLTLGSFNGLSANGSWTLFVADMSSGGESQLISWSLEISTIPEPHPSGLLILSACVLRFSRRAQRIRPE